MTVVAAFAPGPSGTAPRPPALSPVTGTAAVTDPREWAESRWQVSVPGAGETPLPTQAGSPVLRSWAGIGVLVGVRYVLGLDARTGDRLWERLLPRRCSVSDTTPYAGSSSAYLAVVTGTSCSELLLLDVRTGAERWRVTAGFDASLAQVPLVAAGERAVTVIDRCETVWRFDLATGRELAPLAGLGAQRCGAVTVDTDGVSIVAWVRTSGDGAPGTLVVFDADSGEVLWRRPGTRTLDRLKVLNSSPLVLEEGGRRGTVVREYVSATGPPTTLWSGSALDYEDDAWLIGTGAATLFGVFGTPWSATPVRGYELGSGREPWECSVDQAVVGVDDRGVLAVVTELADVGMAHTFARVTPQGRTELLGRIPAEWYAGDRGFEVLVHGGLVLLTSGDGRYRSVEPGHPAPDGGDAC
ncbi:PQQ-binding-like beta-propeller repeat protein [Nocardioides sp. zg-536]|uniref:PQQ-binding-like beta-propeller repeat protein n=1 Tax=Nocardioides faecalis TaxID=2803858 RepID=A0A938Y5M6_9ACTN|nr:PQQ-binding-like beta-propeller repeat protein [Nocardioides faecalis]MBM9459680.1 PQQ-binding-like beta-propeller repeat protein [Nocardioides faecalis]QVI58200.1 PQQ-binding-like beta-propeller repeat protein [Nocardioides faecalis]